MVSSKNALNMAVAEKRKRLNNQDGFKSLNDQDDFNQNSQNVYRFLS